MVSVGRHARHHHAALVEARHPEAISGELQNCSVEAANTTIHTPVGNPVARIELPDALQVRNLHSDLDFRNTDAVPEFHGTDASVAELPKRQARLWPNGGGPFT